MKLSLIAPLAFAAASAVWPAISTAAPVSPERALAIAMQARGESDGSRKVPGSVDPSIVMTRSARGLSTAIYGVDFGNHNGFAIVSGDDNAPAILAFSDNGRLDPADMPPAFDALLADYAVMVARAAEGEAGDEETEKVIRPEIAPIVKTTWNQMAPYNAYCPKTGYDRAPVGCVALSTGQVMRTHQWPPNSRGTVVYDAGKFRLNTEYDWASMPDSGLGLPASETDNMAKMLYELARSLYMVFTGNSSGTYSYYTPEALVLNFSYDPAVDYLSRNFYTDSQWENIIYAQLAAGQAMAYDGMAVSEGHSFVCDGYRDGYFHINWGWEGKSDGYFLLSNLDPGEQGVGGASSGFFRRHAAVTNIRVPQGGTQPMRLCMTGSLGQGEIPNTFRVAFYDFDGWGIEEGIFNLTGRDFHAALGLRAVNVSDPSKVEYFFEEPREWVRWFTRAPFINVDITSLPEGRYYIYPVAKDEFGRISDILPPASRSNVLDANISGGTYACTEVKKEGGAPKGVTSLDDLGVDLSINRSLFDDTPDLVLQPGEYSILHPYLVPLDADSEFEWETLDPEVVAVSGGMVMAGGKLGRTMVTAYVKGSPNLGRQYLVEVVEPVMISSIGFTYDNVNLAYGQEYELTPVIAPANVSNSHLKYSSSDEEIATISSEGVVTAKDREGVVEISAETLDGSELTAICTVQVSKEGAVGCIVDSESDAASAPVFTSTGIRVAEAAAEAELQALPAGLYIWKGRKLIITD